MFRKLAAAVLIATAFASAFAAIPGLIENTAFACNKPDCD
jgi:hypothetical protein